MIDMVNKQIIPAVLDYENELAGLVKKKKALNITGELEENRLLKISKLSDCLGKRLECLQEQLVAVKTITDNLELAQAYRKRVFQAMRELRLTVDELELLVSSKHWTIPTYAEMLYSVNE